MKSANLFSVPFFVIFVQNHLYCSMNITKKNLKKLRIFCISIWIDKYLIFRVKSLHIHIVLWGIWTHQTFLFHWYSFERPFFILTIAYWKDNFGIHEFSDYITIHSDNYDFKIQWMLCFRNIKELRFVISFFHIIEHYRLHTV